MQPKNASRRPSTNLEVDRSTSGYKGRQSECTGAKSGFGAGNSRATSKGLGGEPQPSDSNATPQHYQTATDGIE